MTPQFFAQQVAVVEKKLNDYLDNIVPKQVGDLAVGHFKENFRKGGFVNDGLHEWKPAKRQGTVRGTAGKYTPLLSGHNHHRHPQDAQIHMAQILRSEGRQEGQKEQGDGNSGGYVMDNARTHEVVISRTKLQKMKAIHNNLIILFFIVHVVISGTKLQKMKAISV